ncbi:hypothetical protein KFE94_17010 [bacterium SCSIO 12643]|nr:hypothetical protein KFE94_17010 [bacterium SCSIO 12643]
MDTALVLKKQFDQQQIITFDDAKAYLEQSVLFQQLLEEFDPTPLNLLHRLLELIEIPFSTQYRQVQEWRDQLVDLTFTGHGFSLTGQSDYILACYNGMITHVLMKLDYSDHKKIEAGIQWILKYQNVSRGAVCLWQGEGIQKYGGCMKSTPCYVGVVKSMQVLSEARKQEWFGSLDVRTKLSEGLEYILQHQVYLRQSNHQPITSYITRLTFPYTYKTNILEILTLLKENEKHDDERCIPALDFLRKKKKKQGYWVVNSIQHPKHWIAFDQTRQKGDWISYEIEKLL